jgi:hypothetical protein
MITKDEALLAAADAAVRYQIPWNSERVEALWHEGNSTAACWIVTSAGSGASAFWQEQEIDDNGCSLVIDGESGTFVRLELQRLTLSRVELESLRERRLAAR